MDESQRSQEQFLYSLHDKEVQNLMKRLELQNKEELVSLSKTHKDKNELARIKRELQQKLIDQAVVDRQRFRSLLDKRSLELKGKHSEMQRKLDEEKARMREQRLKEHEEKCRQLKSSCSLDKGLFVQMYLTGKRD